MRRSHVIGIAIISLLTVGSVAQAQNATPGAPQARQQRNGRFEKGRGRLMRGIKLSDAEKARVKEIRERYKTESKTLRESLRPAMQDDVGDLLLHGHPRRRDDSGKQPCEAERPHHVEKGV